MSDMLYIKMREKINTFEQIFELSEYFQNKIKSPIAGNILFLK